VALVEQVSRHLGQLGLAAPGAYHERMRAGVYGCFHITYCVANHERLGEIDIQAICGLVEKTGAGLTALAAFIRSMWAVEDGIDAPSVVFDGVDHAAMDFLHRRGWDYSTIDGRLVGDYDNDEIGLCQQAE
jgi:hypothetical protein